MTKEKIYEHAIKVNQKQMRQNQKIIPRVIKEFVLISQEING